MGRKQDKLWKHATRSGKKFKCKFCGKGFPGTTSVVRFRFHLAGITGQGVHVCQKVPEAVKEEAMNDVPEAVKEDAMDYNNKKQKTGSSSPKSEISDSSCSNEMDNLLAKFVEMNNIDCSAVESLSFLNLVQALRKYGPGNYVPPSSDTLRSKLIPLFKEETEQSVARGRQSWETTGITLVPHTWCSKNNQGRRSFLSIIACCLKRAVVLNTLELPEDISLLDQEIFRSVIQDVGPENIMQCIVGGDAPLAPESLFGQFLAKEYPHVHVTKCAALDIRSLLDEICTQVKWVGETPDAAQAVFDYACENEDILALMIMRSKCNYNGGRDLKQFEGYDMLEAICEAKEELIKLVQSPDHECLAHGKQGIKTAQIIIKSEEFWDQLEKLRMALEPLSRALCLDAMGGLGFGDLYRLMRKGEEATGKLCNDSPDKISERLVHILVYKRRQVINGIHKAAAFLNPQFICTGTVDQDRREMDQGIEYMLTKLVAAGDREAFVDQIFHYREMMSNPSQLLKTIAAKRLPPCEWWRSFGYEFPTIANYAIRILSQPCSSLSCMSSLRAFLANQIEQRRGLVPDLDDMNMRMNAFFMEKLNTTDKASKKDKADDKFGEHKLTKNGSSLEQRCIVEEEITSRPLMRSIHLPAPQYLKLRFMTSISSPLVVGQKVEGEQGPQIHVILEDPTPASSGVLQVGLPSMLRLAVSVFDGDFINEASSGDDYWTREQFDSSDLGLTRKEPFVTGDLHLLLEQAKGILGDLCFNYSSVGTTRSGQFRLGVKTATGYCQGIRILEGISRAFIVVDNEASRMPAPTAWDISLPDNFTSSIFEGLNGLVEGGQYNDDSNVEYPDLSSIWKYQFQSSSNPKHAAARRIKKKAFLHLQKRQRMQSDRLVNKGTTDLQALAKATVEDRVHASPADTSKHLIVLSIDCLMKGSSKAGELTDDMLQTGDIVEELRIGGSVLIKAPFKDGKSGVQRIIHHSFKSKDTSIVVRVRRGSAGDYAELQACIVPSVSFGKKQYILRAIDDPNYAVGFCDRTESECLQLIGFGAVRNLVGSGGEPSFSPSGTGRFSNQMTYLPRQQSGQMSPIAEIVSKGVGKGSPEGGGDYDPDFQLNHWDDSLSMSEGFGGLGRGKDVEAEDGETRIPTNPPLLAHHLSLPNPKASEEMNYLRFQDSVPCKVRAKRGFETHPRSIAERVRRTKISERIRKLQDLVPNMDKQTNTSDMFDLAVDYIKVLQDQVKSLSDNRSKCVCSNKQML